MANPYSEDLRRRVLSAYDGGQTTEEVAERFGVSISFVRNLRALRDETGQIKPRHKGGGNPRRLSPDDERAARRWCKRQRPIPVF